MEFADALDQNGYSQLAREARQLVWEEAERQWNKPKWNGRDCTNCGQYHGYESIYTYGQDVLCSPCNYRFLAWVGASAE